MNIGSTITLWWSCLNETSSFFLKELKCISDFQHEIENALTFDINILWMMYKFIWCESEKDIFGIFSVSFNLRQHFIFKYVKISFSLQLLSKSGIYLKLLTKPWFCITRSPTTALRFNSHPLADTCAAFLPDFGNNV